MLEFSQQNNDSEQDSSPTALVVGRVRPPEGIWPFLDKVVGTSGVDRGALIIFSQRFRGRIAVSSSRYITGAVEEATGLKDLEAVKALLSIKTGMFGFRPAVGMETEELEAGMRIDMVELLALWKKHGSEGYSPADAIEGELPQREMLQSEDTTLNTTAVASMMAQVRQTALDEESQQEQDAQNTAAEIAIQNSEQAVEADEHMSTEETASETADESEAEEEGALGYLDWFTDQVGDQPSMPRFKDILMPVLPRQNLESTISTPAEQIPVYRDPELPVQSVAGSDLERISMAPQPGPNVDQTDVPGDRSQHDSGSLAIMPPSPAPQLYAPWPRQPAPEPGGESELDPSLQQPAAQQALPTEPMSQQPIPQHDLSQQPVSQQPVSQQPVPQQPVPDQADPHRAVPQEPVPHQAVPPNAVRPAATVGQENLDQSAEVKKLTDLLQAEIERPKAWSAQDLNSIPTPRRTSEHSRIVPPTLADAPIPNATAAMSAPTQPLSPGRSSSGSVVAQTDKLAPEENRTTAPRKSTLRHDPDEYAQKQPALLSRLWHEHPRIFGLVCLTIIGIILFVISTDQTSKDQSGIIASGRIALQRGNYADAQLLFTQAIEKKPTAHAYFYRGVAYARAGESEKAITDLNLALKLGASETRVRTMRASVEAHMGDYDKAIDDASVVIVDDPKSAEAYQIRALCRSQRNEWDSVVKDCSKALEFCKDPEITARLYLERAFAYGKLNKNADAEADLDKAVEAKPVPFVFMQRGDIYRKDKKYQTAVENYTNVLEFDPRSTQAYVARGISEAGLHREEDALRDFGRALSIDPRNVEALIQRGSLHITRKEWRMAANDLEESIDLNPTIRESHQKLHVAYDHLNRTMPGRFAADLSKVADLPSNPESGNLKIPGTVRDMIDLGYKSLYGGSAHDAVTYFMAALTKEPNNTTARKYLAYALVQTGANADAAVQFQTLNSLQPLETKDRLSLVKCLMSSGQDTKGLQLLTQTVQSDPNSVAAKVELTKIYVARKAMPAALEMYRQAQAVARTPADKELLQNIIPAGANSTPANSTPTGTPAVPVDPSQRKHGGV